MLPYRLGEPFTRLPDVRQFQIDWDGETLLARVVLRGRRTPPGRPELSRALHDAGAAPIPITVVPVAELEREPGPAAKLKLIRNLKGQTPLGGGDVARRRRGGRAREVRRRGGPR